jgi:hypothetical protein
MAGFHFYNGLDGTRISLPPAPSGRCVVLSSLLSCSGAHLSTLLARAVLAARPEEPERVMFGTIHADNAGAYPAALRAGRADVGGWVQLGLSGL